MPKPFKYFGQNGGVSAVKQYEPRTLENKQNENENIFRDALIHSTHQHRPLWYVKAPRYAFRLIPSLNRRMCNGPFKLCQFAGIFDDIVMGTDSLTLLSVQLVIAEQTLCGETQRPQMTTQIFV